MNAKLKYSKMLRVLPEVLLLIGCWRLNRYINFFTLRWNQLAFAVPVTVTNLIVSRCFCYHDTDHLGSPFFLPGTIDSFNRQYCMNFSLHVALMTIFICLVFLRRQPLSRNLASA